MELEAQRFYQKAIARTEDASTRELLEQAGRRRAETYADGWESRRKASDGKRESRGRRFAQEIVFAAGGAAGAGGLMDGSVSTLAPLFAAAFATHKSWDAFLVGLAASIGAGISMGFAESLSDDGSLTGRGSPWIRGVGDRTDDDGRRDWAHVAVSDRKFSMWRLRWR